MIHNFSGDYKSKLHEYITEIQRMTRAGNDPACSDRTNRMGVIARLVDEYIEQTGEMPDAKPLERLADLCLYEEITDPHPDKMTRNEYPIMSWQQLDRRREGKQVAKKGRNKGEIPLEAAKHFGVDMRNYRAPVRRTLNTVEALNIDHKTRSRNAERQRKYREFTKVQPVVTYRISELRGAWNE